jgi:hypothetical protein
LASKFSKSAKITQQLFLQINKKKISKNAEFHADFESVGKVVKICTKKKLKAKQV